MIVTEPALTQQTLGQHSLFEMRFPSDTETLEQDAAWCEVKLDGEWRRFRFHDYDEIYEIPGLYECLFYRSLRCCSPAKVVGLLNDVLNECHQPREDLRAFDVGAGNGMVGESLQSAGINHIVGIDIIKEAKTATERDRPWVYEAYHVGDLTHLDEPTEEKVRKTKLNVLTTVAALGFGDIPNRAFLKALDLIETPAWVAINAKEDFLTGGDKSGFAALIDRLQQIGVLQVQATRRYCHRLSYTGDPLYYVAIVASKERDVPDETFDLEST